MSDDFEVHPNAPAAEGGMGYFRSAKSTGLHQQFDAWFSRKGRAQLPATDKKAAITIPGAPLWHMGRVAVTDSESSFKLLQGAIDHLANKGRQDEPFTADEKEFMKELFEALWWGGKYQGMPEAAQLASHYVNGGGADLEIDAEVYRTSVIVKDTMAAMKGFVLANADRKIKNLISSDADFLKSAQAKSVLSGRTLATHGTLKSGGALQAEQKQCALEKRRPPVLPVDVGGPRRPQRRRHLAGRQLVRFRAVLGGLLHHDPTLGQTRPEAARWFVASLDEDRRSQGFQILGDLDRIVSLKPPPMRHLSSVLAALTAALALTACVQQAPCVIADTVQTLKTISLQGEPHALVLRLSGLQDKVASYELYAGYAPVFDVCGSTRSKPVAMVTAEQGNRVARVLVQNRRLLLQYGHNDAAPTDPAQVAVEVR